MVANDQSFEFELDPHALRDIEHFAELICDQLFINETYYGNILMSLTEFFNLLIHNKQKGSVKATYNTDYQEIRIIFQPIDSELVKQFEQEISLDSITEDYPEKSVYLISKLTDAIEIIDNDSISLTFDISALHNEVYEHRKSHLHSYFHDKKDQKKVKEKDDQL